MGRVNTETMYPLVKSWAWGKRGDQDIYYDVESRKNSITYRGNMIRLIDQLIIENDYVKAEEILDLAIAKMPHQRHLTLAIQSFDSIKNGNTS